MKIFAINKCLRINSEGLKTYIEAGFNQVHFLGEPTAFEKNTLSQLQPKLNKLNIDLHISSKEILDKCDQVFSYVDFGKKTVLFKDFYVWKKPYHKFTLFYNNVIHAVEGYHKFLTPPFKKVKLTNIKIKPHDKDSNPYKTLSLIVEHIENRVKQGLPIKSTMLSRYINNGLVDPRLLINTFRKIIDVKFFLIRDYYKNLYPTLTIPPGNGSSKYFEAWKEGKTGYLMIDACMLALLKDGFLDNNKRYLVAHFWIHKCGGDWTLGEKHFAQYLVDYDLELSICNWLYVEGTLDPIKKRTINYDKIDDKFIMKYSPKSVARIL